MKNGSAPIASRPLRLARHLLGSSWGTRLVERSALEERELEAIAIAQTGLSDFGRSWFRRPLRLLLRSLEEEARLNPVGRMVASAHVLKLLRERLWAEHWFSEHPEIRRRPIAPPVVVVGAMRSGTTRLHRLLSADVRFAHLRMFETICPVPRPHRPGRPDFRPLFASFCLGLLHRANPATAAVHPTGPMQPEEELGLLVASAWGMKHEVQWRVPSYARWCEGEDAAPAYAHMADLLRLTSWLRDEDPRRPWLLKTPQHMLDLPALLQVFPDARLVFIHRDPAAVVGSSCSMVWNQMGLQSDEADPKWIGREWLRKTRLKVDRMLTARTSIPSRRAVDVLYSEMETDWQQPMRRIYDRLDLDIAPALPAMRTYVERSESRPGFRTHRYSLAAFGLEGGAVRDRFRDYVERFGLEPDGEDLVENDRLAAAA